MCVCDIRSHSVWCLPRSNKQTVSYIYFYFGITIALIKFKPYQHILTHTHISKCIPSFQEKKHDNAQLMVCELFGNWFGGVQIPIKLFL